MIAQQNGVRIPGDVEFTEETGDLGNAVSMKEWLKTGVSSGRPG